MSFPDSSYYNALYPQLSQETQQHFLGALQKSVYAEVLFVPNFPSSLVSLSKLKGRIDFFQSVTSQKVENLFFPQNAWEIQYRALEALSEESFVRELVLLETEGTYQEQIERALSKGEAFFDEIDREFFFPQDVQNPFCLKISFQEIDRRIVHAFRNSPQLSRILEKVCEQKYRSLMQAIIHTNNDVIISHSALKIAIRNNWEDLVKSVLFSQGEMFSDEETGQVLKEIAIHGSLDFFEKASLGKVISQKKLEEALVDCAWLGYLGKIQALIPRMGNISKENLSWAFRMAAEGGHFHVVQYFLELPEAIAPDVLGEAFLSFAKRGGLDEMQYFINAPLGIPCQYLGKALALAAVKNRLAVIMYLLPLIAEKLSIIKERNTLLEGFGTAVKYAAINGHSEIIQALLMSGIDLDLFYFQDALLSAAEARHFAAFLALMESSNIDFCEGCSGISQMIKQIQESVMSDDLDPLRTCLIVKMDAKFPAERLLLLVSLLAAAKKGNLPKFQAVLGLSRAPLKEQWIKDILRVASIHGHLDILRYFVELLDEQFFSVEENIFDVLSPAVLHNQIAVVQYFSSFSVSYDQGITLMSFAVHTKNVEMVRLLLTTIAAENPRAKAIAVLKSMDLEIVKKYLSLDDPEIKISSLGQTFVKAVKGNHKPLIEHLLSIIAPILNDRNLVNNPDLEMLKIYYRQAVVAAIEQGLFDIVEMLFSVDSVFREDAQLSLIQAIADRDIAGVRNHCEFGVRVLPPSTRLLAAAYATYKGHLDTLQTLISHETTVSKIDIGWIVRIAATYNRLNIIQYLTEWREISSEDYGDAISIALKQGHFAVSDYLLY